MNGYAKYVVCYDISDNRNRAKFYTELKNLGLIAVQYSVFLGELNSSELKWLTKLASQHVKSPDKCFWFQIPFDVNNFSKFPGYQEFKFIEHDGYDCI